MKKLIFSSLLGVSVLLWSCGGNPSAKKASDTAKSTEKEKTEVKAEKKPLKVTLTLGDKKMELAKPILRNTAVTPTEKSDTYNLCAGATADNGGTCVVSLEFTATGPVTIKDASFDIHGYLVDNAVLEIKKFETKEGNYHGVPTGIKVTSIEAVVTGKARKDNGLGQAPGESQDFTCTISQ